MGDSLPTAPFRQLGDFRRARIEIGQVGVLARDGSLYWNLEFISGLVDGGQGSQRRRSGGQVGCRMIQIPGRSGFFQLPGGYIAAIRHRHPQGGVELLANGLIADITCAAVLVVTIFVGAVGSLAASASITTHPAAGIEQVTDLLHPAAAFLPQRTALVFETQAGQKATILEPLPTRSRTAGVLGIACVTGITCCRTGIGGMTRVGRVTGVEAGIAVAAGTTTATPHQTGNPKYQNPAELNV